MNSTYTSGCVAVSIVVTFFLRALPFFAFKEKEMPKSLNYLGKTLPPTIMAVLVVYCLKNVPYEFQPTGIASLIAVGVTVISYKGTHSTLVGILAGTVTNMVLLHIL